MGPHTIIKIDGWAFYMELNKAFNNRRGYTFRLLADGGIILFSIRNNTGDPLDLLIIEANDSVAIGFHHAVFERTVLDEENKEATKRKS